MKIEKLIEELEDMSKRVVIAQGGCQEPSTCRQLQGTIDRLNKLVTKLETLDKPIFPLPK